MWGAAASTLSNLVVDWGLARASLRGLGYYWAIWGEGSRTYHMLIN